MLKNLVCLVATLSICALATAQRSISLIGNTWKLTELDGKPAIKGGNGVPWLLFEAKSDKLTGYGGINRFQGKYKIAKGTFQLDPGMSTLIGASKPLMDQETAFHAAIQAANDYRIVKTELRFLKNGKVVARFKV